MENDPADLVSWRVSHVYMADCQSPMRKCSSSLSVSAGKIANSWSLRRGKSDLILETVLRMESFLHEMNNTLVCHQC